MDIFDRAEARISELEPMVSKSQKEIEDLKGLVTAGRAAKKVQDQAEESIRALLVGEDVANFSTPSAQFFAADVTIRAEDKPKALKPTESPNKSNVRTAKERVKADYNGHPELTVAEIAEKAGVPKSTAQTYINELKRRSRGKVTEPGVSTDKAPIRPKIPNEPLKKTAYPVKPRTTGTQFMLLDRETKKYLHGDLNAMSKNRLNFTNDKIYAWCGTERQMANVRKMLPATIECIEQVVEQ